MNMHTATPDEILRKLLDAGEVLTLQQIQQKTGIGERQVRRMVRRLQREGTAVLERWEGRHKVFYLPAERQQVVLPDLRFDAAELRALAIAAKASRSVLVGTPHAEALKSAFDKLLERAQPVTYVFDVEESMQEWHFEDNPADCIALECFRQLENAMDERRSVYIDYLTAKDQRQSYARKVNPYFFGKRNRAWMLVAYCHKRREPTTFSLSRISQVVPCDDAKETAYFTVPDDFKPEEFFQASLGAITSGECFVLRLLVEPDKALHFRQRQYHPTQIIEEERLDGRLVVSYELEGFEEIRSFCQGWGVGITVLAPDVLRERLQNEAQTLIERYKRPPA